MSLQVQDVLNALQQMQKSLECSICLELLKDPHSTKCNHQFCGQCIRKVLEKSSKSSKNKWYCPLCKTPVSKRSLTPNPTLSEIVAAVRNLQVAIQDDTGIPAGSPPLEQSKPCLLDANTSVSGHSSSHLLSTSKEVTADEDAQGHQPHSVSKVNIRSCLRASEVGHKKAPVVKSKKLKGTNSKCTRNTRHSKRISQKNDEVEDISEKSMNVDLLHMIDTMSFQPASNTDMMDSSKDFVLVPSTHESTQSDESVSSHDLSKSTKKEVEMGGQDSRCENITYNVEQLNETTRCLTTIAEADSSSICRISCNAKIAPNNSIMLCDVAGTDTQPNEAAVSSTKFESSPQSTVNTMQSLSILPPLGYFEGEDICDTRKDAAFEKGEEISDEGLEGNLVQQTCSALNGFRPESQVESHQNHEDITYEEMKGKMRITTEVCSLENQAKPRMEISAEAAVVDQDDYGRNVGEIDGMNTAVATEEERKMEPCLREDGDVCHNKRSSRDEPNDIAYQNDGESDSNPAKACVSECQKEPIDIESQGCKRQQSLRCEVADSSVPNEVFEKGVSDLAEQSLDFEGLVSLFHDPSERRRDTQRDEVENAKSCEDIFERDGQSSEMKEYCQADLQHMENIDAGRVNLKKRKREIELEDDPGSGPEPAEKETSPSKHFVCPVHEFDTYHESKLPTSQVGARKKLKVSNRSSLIKTSPVVEGMIKQNSQEPRGGFIASDKGEAVMGFSGDELEVNGFSFSQKEFPNEIVPNSASTSNTPNSLLINPMIVYADHTLYDLQTSVITRKEICSSLERKNSGHEERTKTANHAGKTRGDVQGQSQEQSLNDREPWINFIASTNSNPDRQEAMPGEISQGDVRRCLIDEGEEGEEKKDEQSSGSKDASSDASESILVTSKRKYETNEVVKMEYHHRIDDTQALTHDVRFSREQKATTHSLGVDICHLSESRLGNAIESVVKTSCELLAKAALSTVSTPTQNSLDSQEEDTVTPCLFGSNSCEASQETKSNRDQNREMSELNSIPENQDNKPNISRDVVPSENVTDDESSYADEASNKTCSEGMKVGGKCRPTEVRSPCFRANTLTNENPDDEETQSFGTFQSISILQDAGVLSQEQQEYTGTCNDALVHQTSHVQNGNNAASSWAEPLPKGESALHPFSQGIDRNGSCDGEKGRGKGRTSFSQLTDSEVIPPTPPVRATTRLNFAGDAPSIVKESRSVKDATEGNAKKKHEYLITSKKLKRIQNRDCCKSSMSIDQGNRVSTMKETTRVLLLTEDFSLANEVAANVSCDNADQDSKSDNDTFPVRKRLQDKVAATIRHDCKSSKDTERHLDSPSRRGAVEEILGNKAGNSSQNGINREKARNENHDEVRSKKCTEKDFLRKRSPEESNAFLQKTFDDEDTFDCSGTQSKVKVKGNFQGGRSCIPAIFDDTKDYPYLAEDKDNRFEDLSKAKHDYQDLDDEFVKRADSSQENKGGSVVVDDEDCLSVDERDVIFDKDVRGKLLHEGDREESSDDEALLKPAFLSKESESATNDGDCQEDVEDIEEDEEPILSQELLLSENDGGVISSSYKALDSTCASSATFLSEAAASTQKMEVLRQDVEAMEREMEELRAYLANADESREAGTDLGIEGVVSGDEVDNQCDAPDMQPSLTPPPPLTPKSIPPMRQLATPLKEASRYLDHEGQSSDEESECSVDTVNDPVTGSRSLTCSSFDKPELIVEKRRDSPIKPARKRPFSPDFETDGESVKAAERRLVETPSPPSSKGAVEILNDGDKLIALEDRDSDSRAGSLLLVKKRKLSGDFIPKKSPVVSLLFRNSRINPREPSAMSKSEKQPGGSSPVVKRSSSFLYSRKRGSCISPISRAQLSLRTQSAKDSLLDTMSRNRGNSQKEDILETGENLSFSDESRKSGPGKDAFSESLSGDHRPSPDLVLTVVKNITNSKVATDERERRNSSGCERQLSFVATRLNRQQLADARALAEAFGGKLASEFNSKTSHVIMATDENMQVTRHSYTMKYLLGLSLGKWIVSHHWIVACKQAKTLVSEANYEVKGDSGLGQNSVPRKARKARAKKETLLFHEFDVLCFGGFGAAVRRGQLCQLLKFCGARVFVDAESIITADVGRQMVVVIDKERRENMDEIKVLSRQLKMKAVSLEWATDSIANYKVQDLRDYIVKL